MAEPSIDGSFEYRKVPFVIDAPPLNVVEENRFLKGSKALLHWSCPQATRFFLILVSYTVCLTGSFWLAYQFRFDFNVPEADLARFHHFIAWIIPVKLAILLVAVQFDGLLSYFSIPDLRRLLLALSASTLILACLWWKSDGQMAPPRGVIMADLLISFLAVSTMRLWFRVSREIYLSPGREWSDRVQRVGIIGAGDVGASVVRELSLKSYLGLRPVAFFDDDPKKWNCRVHNIPVVGAPESLVQQKKHLRLDRVILAMPSATRRRCREITELLQRAQIRFENVPSFDQLATGKVRATPLRSVRVEELFGNDRLHVEPDKIRTLLRGRTVLVTGAGGRVGSELCRQIAPFGPRQLLLLEQCEVQIFQIEQELIRSGCGKMIVPLVGDILDEGRTECIFKRYRPEVVFHAAVHRRATVMENHPSEAIKTNCFGTARIGQLAAQYGTNTFVFISSDHARNGGGVLGASKLLAELFIRAMAAPTDNSRRFFVLRLGSLIGSSDRMIRRFHEQIESGGPLEIPDPNAVCYSMTLSEAAKLSLQAAADGTPGSVITFDLGKPVKLLELANKMVELCGLKPDQDIEIAITGFGTDGDAAAPELCSVVREGDSRKPDLLSSSELIPFDRTAHPRILRAQLPKPSWTVLEQHLQRLRTHVDSASPCVLKSLLNEIVAECQGGMPAAAPAANNKALPNLQPS